MVILLFVFMLTPTGFQNLSGLIQKRIIFLSVFRNSLSFPALRGLMV